MNDSTLNHCLDIFTSDILNGRSVSMMETIRQAVEMSKLRKLWHESQPQENHLNGQASNIKEGIPEENLAKLSVEERYEDLESLSYKEAFRIATLGGAAGIPSYYSLSKQIVFIPCCYFAI